ncbi:MAG TPA: PRC-barrel domain-containing protein [Acidimicrobiales bacterium]|jgi:hypothetical protein|nr:PRC-barrel domain-containing protein [Acidimicrobiales bacterium]
MTTVEDISQWRGDDVVDPGGEKIGKLEAIYYDAQTDEAVFFGVKTGFLGHRLHFVPVQGASVGKGYVVVDHARSVVRNAPTIDMGMELPADEEPKIFEFYGMAYTPGSSPSGKRLFRR